MPRALLSALPVMATVLVLTTPPQAVAQDYTMTPTFGVISLSSNFLPDPNWISLLAGGGNYGTYTDAVTGTRCAGYFASAPDLRVHFATGENFPLSFYVDAREDTVLLVNTPDGVWHCNDDSQGLNPALTFENPLEGQYDIWVGTYAETNAEYPPATLSVTELAPFAGSFERAFFGNDDRVIIDPATGAPWSMIGFVDLSQSSCTGTLIGPATVLTAAHCIANDGVIDTPPVEFLAGFSNGTSITRSAVTGFHVPARWLDGEQDGTDFAFLYLADPIGDDVGWMQVGPFTQAELSAYQAGNGPDILQAGYSYDQQGVLTGNLDCPFIDLGPQNQLIHECDTLQGDSGSPLFIAADGGYRIVGVESHTESQPREPFDLNVAMYAEAITAELRAVASGGGAPTTTRPEK
jgi:protease YdgD